MSVPGDCAANALFEINLWPESKFRASAAGVERAALRVEVHAASIQRRLNPQRHAHRLAHQACDPERPHRQMPTRRLDAELLGDKRNELIERRVSWTRQQIRPSGRGRHLATESKSFDKIIDVREVIKDLTGPK